MKQRRISEVLKEQYEGKVLKLSLTAGCTCPTRDGTKGWGGCSFCSEGGSGEFAAPDLPLPEQILLAKEKVDGKFPRGQAEADRKYIAYFQPFSNTYGDFDRLKRLYEETLSVPEIVILSLATRPDCLTAEMVSLLEGLNREKPVWVELGLQTIHERTAEYIRRGYPLSIYNEAVEQLRNRGLEVITHVILGLTGESEQDMKETVAYVCESGATGIKLQLLHVLKGTDLAKEYEQGRVSVMSEEAYVRLLTELLAMIPETTVVHRLTGDGSKKDLIAPLWSADKKHVLNRIRAELNK